MAVQPILHRDLGETVCLIALFGTLGSLMIEPQAGKSELTLIEIGPSHAHQAAANSVWRRPSRRSRSSHRGPYRR